MDLLEILEPQATKTQFHRLRPLGVRGRERTTGTGTIPAMDERGRAAPPDQLRRGVHQQTRQNFYDDAEAWVADA